MSNIDFDLLKIFYEVAKEENITRASKNLYISQPAVSQSIKKLEDELGGILFKRGNKGISLTEEGKSFFEYVKIAIETIKRGEDEFLNYRELQKGKISIGISTMLAKQVLIKPLLNFHKDYKNVKIEIVNGLTGDLLDSLEKGKLDVVIYSENIKNSRLESISIKECHYCFIYNSDFYSFPQAISIKDLINFPLVLQSKNSSTREMFDLFAERNGVVFENSTEVVSQELVKTLTECGLGVGFFIKEFLSKSDKKVLKILKIKEKMPIFQIKLAKSSFQEPSQATKKFIEYIINNN